MSTDEPILPAEPVPTPNAGEPFKPSIVAILAGAAVVVCFAVAAIAPTFTWLSITPTGDRARVEEGIYLSGFGEFSSRVNGKDRAATVSGRGAPDGTLVAIVAGVFGAVALVAVALMFFGLPRHTTQTLLRYTSIATMIGAVALLVWNILWVWKINSFAHYSADEHAFGGTSISPGMGIFVGVGAAVLVAFSVMALASASFERANTWMRIGEVAGLVLSALLLLVVVPWDAEELYKTVIATLGKAYSK